jgi:hypothetical protein
MRKTQNPLTDVALLRLYVYLITMQSAVLFLVVIPILCEVAHNALRRAHATRTGALACLGLNEQGTPAWAKLGASSYRNSISLLDESYEVT